LKKLKLKSCEEATQLLNAIAIEFANGLPMLEVLEIGCPDTNMRGQMPAEYVQALEALLNSFTGLKGLHIDYDGLGQMVYTDCITRHAVTLKD
jgi:hypothetical protein